MDTDKPLMGPSDGGEMTITSSRNKLSRFMANGLMLAVGLGIIFAAPHRQARAQQGKEVMEPAQELFRSLHSDSYSRLMQWLSDGRLDPNLVLDSGGGTFLHYAATNFIDILRAAIASGGNCNVKDAHGATPLHFTAAQSNLGPGPEAVRLLVKCGADLNLRDRRGVTPLHAVYRSVETFAVIRNLNKISAGRRPDVLRALLVAGADPNIKDDGDNTPLMLLIKDELPTTSVMAHLRLLLKHGADTNVRDNKGATPLIQAILSRAGETLPETKDIVNVLIRFSADPNLRDRAGDTALIHAVKHEDNTFAEVTALLAGGADPCLADRNGKLPHDYAGEASPIGRLLFKAGGYRDKVTGVCPGAAAARKKLGVTRRATPLCAGKTGQECWLAVSNRSECYIWNPFLAPDETVTWSGRCNDERVHGTGKAVWRHRWDGEWQSESTEGEYRDGKLNGVGRAIVSNGFRYEGEYHDTKRHGRGILYYPNGFRYEGEYRDNKQHGRGILYYPNGVRYEGEYRDNKQHGRGILYFPSDAPYVRYEGEWRDHKIHGPGVVFSKSGKRVTGNAINGCFSSGPHKLAVGSSPEACGFR